MTSETAVLNGKPVAENLHVRGQGVAGRLFASVCDLAASRGVGSVRVDTHPDNRAMRAALEKAGFTACGELLLDRCEEAGDPRVGYERVLQ